MSQSNDISKKIVETIKSGKIKMKPKALFIFQGIVLIVLAILSMILAIFFTSFTGFALQVKGFSPFLTIITIAVVLFIGLVWVLSKKFSAFYRKPLLLGLAIIFVTVAMVSMAVFFTPIHQRIMDYAHENNLPILSPLYECGCGCSVHQVCNLQKSTNSQPSCGCDGESEIEGSCKIK